MHGGPPEERACAAQRAHGVSPEERACAAQRAHGASVNADALAHALLLRRSCTEGILPIIPCRQRGGVIQMSAAQPKLRWGAQ
eukprot:10997168-Alexandrium_andersonii.AAC.1